MTKYIVKNCTSYHWGGCYYDGAKFECCSKNDDCPIKQVVEMCKQEIGEEVYRWGNLVLNKNNPLAEKILQTLDVQEVE